MPLISPRAEYSEMVGPIDSVRTAIKGQYAVKYKAYTYLPHPSEVDSSSDSATSRYKTYISGAEFDEFPSQTLSATIGKFRVDDSNIVTPERIRYLIEDANGDGQSVRAMIEQSVSELCQVKWQVLVSEYQGLSGLDVSQLSKADVDDLAPRAAIKVYNRESVIDWQFERMNGVMQLTYIVFREIGYSFNSTTFVREEVKTDLILALDENGEYYQQKNVDGAAGERDYVTVGGQRLKWLPVTIIADQELKSGELPQPLGWLSAITDLAYSRYRVSADYKEAMRALPPTTYTKGWKQGDIDVFVEANNGRTAIETGAGAVNNLPGDVTVSIEGADTELAGYERYMQDNERKVRALGGVFKTDDSSTRTATEAVIDSSERVSRLSMIADSIERGYKKALSYCGMFEGLYQPDNVDQVDDIEVSLSREFAKPKLSPEDVDRVINLVISNLMTQSQAIKKLVEGGWHVDDAQTVLDELTMAGPSPVMDEPQAVPANNNEGRAQ